jgi:hypothetical protein
VIGWSDLKLERTGEIWHEAPVSMMKEREFKEGMDEEEEETERTVELRQKGEESESVRQT